MMTGGGAASGSHQGRKVEFRVELPDAFAAMNAPLPVTIREFSTRTAAEGVTGQTISIAPGAYLVVAELPDGATIVEKVDIDEHTGIVHLSPPDEQAEPVVASGAQPHVADGDVRTEAVQPEVAWTRVNPDALGELAKLANAPGEDTSAIFARRYRAVRSKVQRFEFERSESQAAGHIVRLSRAGEIVGKAEAIEIRSEGASLGSIKVFGANQPGHFALLKKGIVSENHAFAIAIPADASSIVEFIIPEERDRLVIAILNNKRANALLSYLVQQSFDRVAACSEESEAMFRELLRSKASDPIGAVIGGYGLLALNRLSPLDQWSQNLPVVAPWLPDSYVIHGETHARLGKHEIAAKAFHELSQCGIPVFSAGLSYAESRVRLYVGHGLPDKDAANDMAAWLDSLCVNVIERSRVGEALTTIIDPQSSIV